MAKKPNDTKRDDAAGQGVREIPIEGTEEAAAAEAAAPAGPAEGADADAAEAEGADGACAAGATPDGEGADGKADGATTEEAGEDAPESDVVREAEAVLEGADGADTDDEGQTPEELVKAAQAEAADWQDKYMRLHAEWDTYRRRMGEQREEEKARATEKLVGNLLPLIDDFERTVSFAEENGEAQLLDGVKAVHAKLVDVLKKEGLEAIDPAGQPYDALEAQAVGTVEDAEAFEETVAEVYQKGYRMGKKVLRPAMVTVTTGGPKRPKEDAEE